MMINRVDISRKELETITAFLDGELSLKEKAHFEERLEQSPAMQSMLNQQAALKSALRMLPVLKAPRNFTLTRAEAQQAKRGTFLQPMFGWASAISALLLAVVFGAEFFMGNFSTPGTEMPAAPMAYFESAQDSQAPEAKGIASEPVYLLNWSGGVYGLGGGGIGSGGKGSESGGMEGFNTGSSINIYIEPVPENRLTGEVGVEDFSQEFSVETYPEEQGIASALPLEEEMPLESAQEAPLENPQEAPLAFSAQIASDPPLILGIQPELLGQIIDAEPQFADQQTQNMPVFAAQPEPAIPPLLKVFLAGLLAIFSGFWLFVRKIR